MVDPIDNLDERPGALSAGQQAHGHKNSGRGCRSFVSGPGFRKAPAVAAAALYQGPASAGPKSGEFEAGFSPCRIGFRANAGQLRALSMTIWFLQIGGTN